MRTVDRLHSNRLHLQFAIALALAFAIIAFVAQPITIAARGVAPLTLVKQSIQREPDPDTFGVRSLLLPHSQYCHSGGASRNYSGCCGPKRLLHAEPFQLKRNASYLRN